MASERFQRVGRGGAGNFYLPGDGLGGETTGNEDPEAQKSSDPVVDAVAVADAVARKPPADFAHTGRGGAGNYYSPKELDGMKVDATDGGTPQLQKAGYRGRGGAGNFMAKDTAEEERLREIEARKRDMVAETARRDVEMALKAPGKAHLAREGLQSTSGWELERGDK